MTDIYMGDPPIYYKCPACGNYYRTSKYITYNSFGSKNYTDGVIEGSMYFDDFWFTTCPKCKNTFDKKYLISLDEEVEIEDDNFDTKLIGKYDSNDSSQLFNPNIWKKVINTELFFPKKCKEKEKLEVRKNLYLGLWRAYNRSEVKKEYTHKEYYNCCKTLINMITPSKKDTDYLLLAELYRNIGEFTKSFETLLAIKEKEEFFIEIYNLVFAILFKKTLTLEIP